MYLSGNLLILSIPKTMPEHAAFHHASPSALVLNARPGLHRYRYFFARDGRLLGVLFHTSTHVAFEWIEEDGMPVVHGPDVRYRMWTKHDAALLVEAGFYEMSADVNVIRRDAVRVLR